MDFRNFTSMAIMNFFVAFGVIIGGCLIGGIGAFLVSKPPLTTINNLTVSLKIWAVVAAIGGTFDTITNIEKGFLDGTPSEVVKHLLLIVSAMTGAHTGTMIVHWFTQESS